MHLQLSITVLLKLSFQIGRIPFQKLETIVFKAQIILRHHISASKSLLCIHHYFFPECFNNFWENSLCTEDPLPCIHLSTTVGSLVSYKKTLLALEMFLFVLFLLFLHPFTNCYFMYFCGLFSFSFSFNCQRWWVEGTWGILRLIRPCFDTELWCQLCIWL